MKYIPILFSTPMVQAILNGSKTQTRRVVKLQPGEGEYYEKLGENDFAYISKGGMSGPYKCPYGQVGDILWVREKTVYVHLDHAHDLLEGFKSKRQIIYGTDFHDDWMIYAKEKYGYKWTPSLFMAKHHCRIFLKITNLRVERLQDISEEDAISEGITYPAGFSVEEDFPSLIFSELWESINGLESWDANPWVWVIEFERIERPLIFVSN